MRSDIGRRIQPASHGVLSAPVPPMPATIPALPGEPALSSILAAVSALRVSGRPEPAADAVAAPGEPAVFHELFELAPDAYLVTDAAGMIRQANRAARYLLAADGESPVGLPLSRFVAPEDRRKLDAAVRSAKGEDGGPRTLRMRTGGGASLRISVSCGIVRGTDGSASGFRLLLRPDPVANDAFQRLRTLRKAIRTACCCTEAMIQADSEAELVEKSCRILAETGGYPLAWIGYSEYGDRRSIRRVAAGGKCVAFLDAAEPLPGFVREGKGPTWRALRTGRVQSVSHMAADSRPGSWRAEAAAHGLGSCVAIPLVSGKQLFGALHVYSERAEGFGVEETLLLGNLAGGLAYGIAVRRSRDDHRRAARALRESEERFRSLVENALVGFFIVKEGRIVFLNPEQERIFGPLPDRFEIRRFERNVHPDDAGRFRQVCGEIVSGKASHQEVDLRFFRFGGRRQERDLRWVHCRATPIDYRGGDAILLNMVDVTRTRELEKIAMNQEKMASLGHVAAGIAHEIRNPLSGVNIYMSTLEKILVESEGLEAESREMAMVVMDLMKSASRKIDTVIGRVRDFLKPGQPRVNLVDINRVIEDVLHLSIVVLRKQSIRITRSLFPDLPPCYADPPMIEQVLLNLLTNAAQAMDHLVGPREIEIRTYVEDGCIVIGVSDSGPGVPPGLREKIFEPFYTTKSDGTGIGLSFSRRVVTDHGGTLTVGVGRLGGADFRVSLPLDRMGRGIV